MSRMTPLMPFLGGHFEPNLERLEADFAFLGVPYGQPYDMRGVRSGAADAPEAVRLTAHALEYDVEHDHWDFDVEGELVPPGVRIADCGDVIGDPRNLDAAPQAASEAVASIVAAGALPMIVGGDDAIPPIVSRGLESIGPVNVLHVDAHLDFRREVDGVTEGYSSPIRVLRGQPWIGHIVQVGLRGVGTARRPEVEDAREAGNKLITARQVHEQGPRMVFDHLPDDARWFVTIDCDGLDPSIAPGVGYPEPDGITFHEVSTLVRGLARADRIAAIELTEYRPALDIRQLTALTIIRLLSNVISLAPKPSTRAPAGELRVEAT